MKRITKHSDYKYWIGSTNIDLAIFPNSVTTFTLLKDAKMSAKIKVDVFIIFQFVLVFLKEKNNSIHLVSILSISGHIWPKF